MNGKNKLSTGMVSLTLAMCFKSSGWYKGIRQCEPAAQFEVAIHAFAC